MKFPVGELWWTFKNESYCFYDYKIQLILKNIYLAVLGLKYVGSLIFNAAYGIYLSDQALCIGNMES